LDFLMSHLPDERYFRFKEGCEYIPSFANLFST
jgi:hypothetical protein